jgi:hypothetical protein
MYPTIHDSCRRVKLNVFLSTAVAMSLLAISSLVSAGDEVIVRAPTKFTCVPSKLRRGDTLTLTFGVPHSAELSIVRPDKAYFPIANRRTPGFAAMGMPIEFFAGISVLVIVPGAFRAQEARQNAPASEPVFTVPGKYKFLLADLLETEDYGQVASCEVTIID